VTADNLVLVKLEAALRGFLAREGRGA